MFIILRIRVIRVIGGQHSAPHKEGTVMTEILFRDESYRIIGACFEVYNEKGCGFLEAVYQECLEIEMQLQGIPFAPQRRFQIQYKGQTLQQIFIPDFICYDAILLELKAVSALADEHRAQIINYLNATGLTLGLLVNFGHYPKLEHERLVHTQKLPAKRQREGSGT
jgi:GxxExxY protein